MPIYETSKSFMSHLFNAWKTGNKNIRFLMKLAGLLTILTVFTAVVGNIIYPNSAFPQQNSNILITCFGLLLFTLLLLSIAISYGANIERERNSKVLTEKELKLAEHPDDPMLGWDLAKIKLESYLNRNLNQVKSIFQLSVFVMTIGFGLIIYGAIMVFHDSINFQASIIASISGLIVNFIGASFLLLYRSIMAQAKEYVVVLERINAVGMSVQVIDTISPENKKLKDETKSELAKQLIGLYQNNRL